MKPKALVAGASGITGSYLAEHLVSLGWEVYGLARKPPSNIEGVRPVAADLLDPASLKTALGGVEPTNVFITTWLRQDSEAENCRVNGAMVENLLTAVGGSGSVQQVGLVTGGKNYFGSFEEQGQYDVTTPFREEQARKPGLNFYYTQEDILFEHSRKQGFSWNVHRPCTVVGYAPGNAMNMATTLAVYATICKETGRPFVFPGSPLQHRCVYRGGRRRAPRETNRVGGDDPRGEESGVQRLERRPLPVGLDVASARRLLRTRSGPLSRKGDAARRADEGRRPRVAIHRREARTQAFQGP